MQKTSLSEHVVLISGGGTGLGNALALGFAKAGAKVWVIGRRVEPLVATVAEITARGGQAGFSVGDVSDAQACKHTVADCVSHFGALHIVINNAGRARFTALADTDDSLIDEILLGNLRGSILLSKYATHELARHRDTLGSAILNIGSTAGQRAMSRGSVYAAAKAGVAHLTRCLALELAPQRTRVNYLGVGAVDTPAMRKDGPVPAEQVVEHFTKRTPLGRMGALPEIVAAAIFLCGPSSAWTTGALFSIDGGLSLV